MQISSLIRLGTIDGRPAYAGRETRVFAPGTFVKGALDALGRDARAGYRSFALVSDGPGTALRGVELLRMIAPDVPGATPGWVPFHAASAVELDRRVVGIVDHDTTLVLA